MWEEKIENCREIFFQRKTREKQRKFWTKEKAKKKENLKENITKREKIAGSREIKVKNL